VKPAEFAYHRPESVADALALLAENPDAKLLAGGQSLLTLMNLRLARPSAVIDIGRLTELGRIFDDTGDLVLGALVTHRTVEMDPLIAARAPLMSDAARYIGHVGRRHVRLVLHQRAGARRDDHVGFRACDPAGSGLGFRGVRPPAR
jgi:carbon-monoxide dehydrogenase medium subunit